MHVISWHYRLYTDWLMQCPVADLTHRAKPVLRWVWVGSGESWDTVYFLCLFFFFLQKMLLKFLSEGKSPVNDHWSHVLNVSPQPLRAAVILCMKVERPLEYIRGRAGQPYPTLKPTPNPIEALSNPTLKPTPNPIETLPPNLPLIGAWEVGQALFKPNSLWSLHSCHTLCMVTGSNFIVCNFF